MIGELYTIGHSTHSTEQFIALLLKHSINCLCDVRSSPYSRYNEQFNREALMEELKKWNIKYVFFGAELGGRSNDASCYVGGQVQFDLLAKTKLFQEGIEKLLKTIDSGRVAIMCAEKDPIMCHRMILVSHAIKSSLEIKHILENGRTEHNKDAEKRLMAMLGIAPVDLFLTEDQLIELAYKTQGKKIAYKDKEEGDE